ncbi:MAG: NAD-binding protein [Candidatus Omnitrophica bacterium]|nr:NAD-binding protein [Candidatus Omnitrophota bacterium]
MDVETKHILFRLKFGVAVLVCVLLGGTIGFWYIEDNVKTFLDSFFFTLVTVTTIGYGNITPETTAGKVLDIFVIISGVGAVVTTIPTFFELIIRNRIKEVLKLPTELTDKSDHYIVCGYGKVGKALVNSLTEEKKSFVVIEIDEDKVKDMVGNNIPVIEGDAGKDNVLERAGVKRAKYLLASLDDATNVFIVLTAKMLNTKIKITCKIEESANESKLKKAGADEVVCCHHMGAQMMMNVTG